MFWYCSVLSLFVLLSLARQLGYWHDQRPQQWAKQCFHVSYMSRHDWDQKKHQEIKQKLSRSRFRWRVALRPTRPVRQQNDISYQIFILQMGEMVKRFSFLLSSNIPLNMIVLFSIQQGNHLNMANTSKACSTLWRAPPTAGRAGRSSSPKGT